MVTIQARNKDADTRVVTVDVVVVVSGPALRMKAREFPNEFDVIHEREDELDLEIQGLNN